MMAMESVDLSELSQTTVDNNEKGPISLEQIRIEESEERLTKFNFSVR